jgi:DNA-directed RNA polymerase specialized sigma24 family protein
MNLLTHSDVAGAIIHALLTQGFRKQDLPDGLQDVYLKALQYFQSTPAPTELPRMMALCAEIARNHAIDLARKADVRKRDLLAPCAREEYWPPEVDTKQRDPIDAGRQLEVLAQLFRERRMPEHGVEILEGVASKCTHEEIAQDLGITDRAVEGRFDTMRRIFRQRMARLGLLPWMQPLRVIVATRDAIASLREAA